MTRKSNNKWRTKKCGRCGRVHAGYSGKLDRNGIEYVVCGVTHKRMNVATGGRDSDYFIYPTTWEKE